jgi:predicted acetyltransferase
MGVIRNPNSNDLPSLRTLLNGTLRKEPDSDVFSDYPLVFCPSNFKNIFIIEENGDIVAAGALYPMTYGIDGCYINFCAISSVATRKEVQGKGYGSIIIEQLIKRGLELKSMFTVLWSDRFDFYKKFGFVLCGKEYALHLSSNKVDFKQSGDLKIVEFRNADNPFAEEMHRLYNHDRTNKVLRRDPKDFAMLATLPLTHYILGFKGNKLVSYLIVGKGEDLTNHIHEFFGNALHILPLIAYSLKSYSPNNLTIIDKEPDSVLFNELQKTGAVLQNRHLALFKILDLDNFLKLLNVNPKIFRAFVQKTTYSEEEIIFSNHSIEGKLLDKLPIEFYLRGLDSV